MTTKKITSDEITKHAVASLPTRPTESVAFGGNGYTSAEMKEAFDKLPKLIIERFNLLISDVEDGQILSDIPTNIESMPTLQELINGIKNEQLSASITIFDTSLKSFLLSMREDIDLLMDAVGIERK